MEKNKIRKFQTKYYCFYHFRAEVVRCSQHGLGMDFRIHNLRYTKVADFNDAPLVKEDIGCLQISE